MNRNLKIGLIIGVIALALLVILPLTLGLVTGWGTCGYEMLEHAEEEEHHMMGPWMMGGFGFGWLMPIFGIVFLGLLIWAVIAIAQGTGGTAKQESVEPKSALEILKDRYARGEIGKEEFEEKRKDLM
jgi:putative membrane protein